MDAASDATWSLKVVFSADSDMLDLRAMFLKEGVFVCSDAMVEDVVNEEVLDAEPIRPIGDLSSSSTLTPSFSDAASVAAVVYSMVNRIFSEDNPRFFFAGSSFLPSNVELYDTNEPDGATDTYQQDVFLASHTPQFYEDLVVKEDDDFEYDPDEVHTFWAKKDKILKYDENEERNAKGEWSSSGTEMSGKISDVKTDDILQQGRTHGRVKVSNVQDVKPHQNQNYAKVTGVRMRDGKQVSFYLSKNKTYSFTRHTQEGPGAQAPHLAYIKSQSDAFRAAGGTIELMATGKGLSEEYRERISEAENDLQNTIDEADRMHAISYKASLGFDAMQTALGSFRSYLPQGSTRMVLVARDQNGNPVAAVDLAVYMNTVRIGYLGSTGQLRGAGTALQLEIAHIAARQDNGKGGEGVPVKSSIGYGAAPYHEKIGRNVESNSNSGWSVAQVKEIAALDTSIAQPPVLTTQIHKYNESEARNERGEWTSSGESKDLKDVVTKIANERAKAANERGMKLSAALKAQVAKDIANRMPKEIKNRLVDLELGYESKFLTKDYVWYENLKGQVTCKGSLESLKSVPSGMRNKDGSDKSIADIVGKPNSGYYRGNSKVIQDLVYESATSSLVGMWASTSNDSNYKALAMQEAAVEEFGLKDVAPWPVSDELSKSVANELDANGDIYRAFLRAQYDNTQELLKSQGVSEVTLYRGMGFNETYPMPEWATEISQFEYGEPKILNVPLRPLTSFAYAELAASYFAKAPDPGFGVELQNTVPASQVLSTTLTGIGCHAEQEIVLLGGTQAWKVTKVA